MSAAVPLPAPTPDPTEGPEDAAAALAAVEAWCDRLPDEQRRAVQRLRARIAAIVPEAREGIHYRVPTFFLHGPLVAVTVNRTELTLITMRPGLLDAMRGGLSGVSWSGSTLRTPLGTPFPDDVLGAIVLARAEQNTRGD
ncbi:MAG TPA: DUF1801 domain-containing protein [Phycicoccus sp.]